MHISIFYLAITAVMIPTMINLLVVIPISRFYISGNRNISTAADKAIFGVKIKSDVKNRKAFLNKFYAIIMFAQICVTAVLLGVIFHFGIK